MEIRLVKRPLQDQQTDEKDLEYVEYLKGGGRLSRIVPMWCVETYKYSEANGGLKKWFEEIERVNPDIIYLYSMTSEKCDTEEEDICHYVRADLRKFT